MGSISVEGQGFPLSTHVGFWLVGFLFSFSICFCFFFLTSTLIKMLGAKKRVCSMDSTQIEWTTLETSVRIEPTSLWEVFFEASPKGSALTSCLSLSEQASMPCPTRSQTCVSAFGIPLSPGGKAIQKWLKKTECLLQGHDPGKGQREDRIWPPGWETLLGA